MSLHSGPGPSQVTGNPATTRLGKGCRQHTRNSEMGLISHLDESKTPNASVDSRVPDCADPPEIGNR